MASLEPSKIDEVPGPVRSNEQVLRERLLEEFFLAAEAARHNGQRTFDFNWTALLLALRALMPSVRRRTRLYNSDADEDWIVAFVAVALKHGLLLKHRTRSYTQYASLMLFKAANVAKRRNRLAWEVPLIDGALPPDRRNVGIPERVHQIQTYEQVRGVIEELRGRLGDTARQVWLDGLSVAQAAQKQGVSRGVIDLHLHRARRLVLCRWRTYRPNCRTRHRR